LLGYTGYMKVIGLTGGIGSGKSTVAGYLKELGARVFDADKIGHEVMLPRTPGWSKLVSTFGESILNSNEEINRTRLGKLVFGNPEAIARLDHIMHPIIMDMVKDKLEQARHEGVKVAVIEAAMLIEADWRPLVDEIWVTVAQQATRVKRLKTRNDYSENDALVRIRSQMSDSERVKHADVVIDTDCNLTELKSEIRRLWDLRFT
jgi:dephospho-CoA kinase